MNSIAQSVSVVRSLDLGTATCESIAHPGWAEVRTAALAAIGRGEAVALLGRAGTGKTLLLHDLAQTLEDQGRTVRLVGHGETPEPVASDDVLLVDEAGRLGAAALRGIGAAGGPIVLAALPDMAERLANLPRPVRHLALNPLSQDDVARFVAARLAAEGRPGDMFEPDAIVALARHSAGLPRLIVQLLGGAMFLAEMDGCARVGQRHVAEAASLRDGGDDAAAGGHGAAGAEPYDEVPVPPEAPARAEALVGADTPAPTGYAAPAGTVPKRFESEEAAGEDAAETTQDRPTVLSADEELPRRPARARARDRGVLAGAVLGACLALACAWGVSGRLAFWRGDAVSDRHAAASASLQDAARGQPSPAQAPATAREPGGTQAVTAGMQAGTGGMQARPPDTRPPEEQGPPHEAVAPTARSLPAPTPPSGVPPASDRAARTLDAPAAPVTFIGPVDNETMHRSGQMSLVIRKRGPGGAIVARFEAWDGLLGSGDLVGTLGEGGRLSASGQLMMGRNPFHCDLNGIIVGERLVGYATFVRNGKGWAARSKFALDRS